MLYVSSEHLKIVLDILEKHVSDFEVRAFGSRVAGAAEEVARIKKYSDLDLVVMSKQPLPIRTLGRLKEEFSDSDLPWRVDIVDWGTTSEAFRRIIEEKYVVVRKT